MVLAFFTGARPTNTFSSRDYDRRPHLLLSALSQPSSPSPAPSIPSSYTHTHRPRAPPDDIVVGSSLGRARRNAEQPSEGPATGNRPHDDSHPYKQQQQKSHRTRSRPLSSLLLAQDQHKPSLFSDFFFSYPPAHNRAAATSSSDTRPDPPKLLLLTDQKRTEKERGAPLVAASQLKSLTEEDQGLTGGALARINPWLSACDLAQPSTAPDLQVRTFDLMCCPGNNKCQSQRPPPQ